MNLDAMRTYPEDETVDAVIIGTEDDFISVQGRIWSGDRTIMTGTAVFKALGQRPPKGEPRK